VNQRKKHLLGLAFDDLALDEAVAALLARPADAPFAYVVTPNADHLARLRRIPGLVAVYQGALLCLLDSQVIGNIARLLHVPHPRVVTGSAITARLLDSLDGIRVAVIGLRRKDMSYLRVRYPGIEFVHHQPPMGLLNDPVSFRRARDFGAEVGARFIFLAVGAPVQELLAYAIVARRTGTGIGLCIGSALEYCAGAVPRAPRWMQRSGLEWLHRLVRAPTRLARRYLLDDPPVLYALVADAIRQRAR